MGAQVDVERVWAEIENEVLRKGVVLQDMKLLRSGVESPWGEVLLGVDSKGRRHLVVPAAADAKERREDSSRGIRIETRPYISDGAPKLYCDVSCRLEELNEMFTAIALDMIDSLEETDADSPFAVCVRVLERWRRLLERVPTRLMSRKAQAGLLAELLFLSRLAERSTRSVDLWVGPEGGRHDFVSEGLDVEVKASLSAEQRRIHVQSLNQLDIPDGARLYLFFVHLREPSGQGLSVLDLVDEVLAKGVNSVQLYDRLSKVGYSPIDREAYAITRFEVLEQSIFRVDDGSFPHLTESSLRGALPSGVLSLSYDIDLDAAGASTVPNGEEGRIVEELADR